MTPKNYKQKLIKRLNRDGWPVDFYVEVKTYNREEDIDYIRGVRFANGPYFYVADYTDGITHEHNRFSIRTDHPFCDRTSMDLLFESNNRIRSINN